MGSKEAGAIYISLQLQTAKLQAGIASAQKSLKSLSRSAQDAGRSMSLAFTLPLASMATYAISSFAKFDDAMTRSMAIMGNVSSEMKSKLVATAEEVSRKTKFSSTEAAEGYYFLASAGLSAEAALKAMPVVANFAAAGNLRLADASDTLVDVLNAVGLASKDATEMQKNMIRVSDTLAKASVDTNVTIGDLSSSLAGPLGGAMRQYGIAVETGTAALESFGSQGIKGKAAGTALSIVIRELAIKSLKNADAFKKYGISVYDAQGKMRNFVDIMSDMDKGLLGISSAERIKRLGELGFTLKNVGFVQSLLGTSEAMRSWEEANATMGTTIALAAANSESFAVQLQILRNRLQNVAQSIGEDLEPTILALGEAIVGLAESFRQLPRWLRLAIEGFAAIVAIGAPLVYIFGNLAGAFSALLGMFKTLGLIRVVLWLTAQAAAWMGVTVAATSATAAVGASATAAVTATSAWAAFGAALLTWPVLVPAALVASAALIYVYWDDITAAVKKFLDWFSLEFPNVSIVAKAAWILVEDASKGTWDTITTYIGGKIDQIKAYLRGLAQESVAAANGVAQNLTNMRKNPFLGGGVRFGAGLAQDFGKLFKEIPDNTIKLVGGMLDIASTEVIENFKMMGNAAVDGSKKIIASRKSLEELAAAEAGLRITTKQESWNSGGTASAGLEAIGDRIKAIKELTKVEENQSTAKIKQKGVEDILADKAAQAEAEARAKAAKKAAEDKADAIESISKSLDKLKNKDAVGDIQDAIKTAMESGADKATFDGLKAKLYQSVYTGYVDGQKDALEKAGNDTGAIAKVHEAAGILAQEALEKAEADEIKSNTKTALDKAEKDKASYDQSVSYYKDIFSKATSETAYNFRDALKDIFVDLAANLAAAIEKALSGTSASGSAGSSGGFGGIIDSVMGMFGGGATQNADGTTGIGPVADGQAYGANIKGSSIGEYAGPAISTVMASLAAHDIDKKNKSNEGTGGAVGAGSGAIVGSFFGPAGAAIGAQVGQALGAAVGSLMKWGPQNPETLARHAFANYVETSFEKMGQVSFYGADGKLKNTKGSAINFSEGMSDFNSQGSANSVSKLNALGKEARTTFYGLGLALKETLGLAEGVGEQFGAMLADNLGGNIDNARLLFQQLGLSLDDMVTKLVELGRNGAQSWLEIETAIQGVTNAAAPGLAAFADYKNAFQGLVESGGRGVAALKGVKDVAQEGIEAGAKSLEELKSMMLNSGLDPEQVNAYFDAVKNRGIQTLAELASVSDRVGGGIVADMNANSASLAAMWAEMGDQLSGIKQKIMDIPTDVVTNYKINVTTEADGSAQKILDGTGLGDALPKNTPSSGKVGHAKGGIITGPIGFGGNHIMGEAGPEGLLPLGRTGDGSLGVRIAGGKGNKGGSGNTIVINAPYATPDTTNQIRRAVMEMEPYLTSRAVDKTIRVANRNGRNFR